tara:strand:- start:14579 stop:14980 length:402 start_codon:yes stop_codon:yes gene_type:complete
MAQSKKKEQKRTEITKEQLLKQLEQNMGNVTLACHFGKCSRSTFYRYYKSDEAFAKQVDDITEIAIDICESELWKQIKDGNVPCILFYLKTKGKKRGYVERQELTGMDGKPINWVESKTYIENGIVNQTDDGN